MKMMREALFLWRRPTGEKTTSLQLRLFAFFALFILILALAFYFLMAVSGVFNAGAKESRAWTENELNHLTGSVSFDFGKLSVQGTLFARQLSSDIDLWLNANGISADALQEYPDRLEPLLSSQAGTLLSMLENSKCSGTFIILDATVNPEQANAVTCRSGIFLKRTEPNVVNLIGSKIYCLRGPASIARENGIGLLGQWQLEFNVSDGDFYQTTLDTARNNCRLDLSRLYYWSNRILLPGNSEPGLLLCIPLISRGGTVYGICGVECSSMLFKLQYSPDNTVCPSIFSTLSPVSENVLDTDAGLIAGNSYLTNPAMGKLTLAGHTNFGFFSYRSADGTGYTGMHETVELYPSGSPYQNQEWLLSVMMPADDWNAAIHRNNEVLYSAVLGLLALSLLLALLISRRYISPVVAALGRIKTDGHAQIQKTKIAEIDDLLEYLAAQDERREALAVELEKVRQRKNSQISEPQEYTAPNLFAYEEFVRNIDTLSAAERAVFNLYLKGYTAKEISEKLCLSINTIKTHNKRIYAKLNVTSRKELMVYVQMMASERGTETYNGK